MSEQYPDLGISQSQDGDYWDIVVSDLDFETDYSLQVAWSYLDKTKVASEYSDRYNFTTPQQEGLLAPKFVLDDLYAINSILYINWNGKDSSGAEYSESILKQVNIWIKGGDFGTEFVQYATSFAKSGLIQINATQKTTYCVKLQAESKNGDFSLFSNEFCVTMLKQPKAVYDVRHTWDKVGNLSVFWKFDPTLKDATNDNTMADQFGLQMLDETNDVDGTWWTAVEKDKIPPLEQKITISANDLQKVFGNVTAFQTDYASFIYVRDKNLQTSLVTGYALTKYSDPLTAPVISVIKGPLSYNVSFTNDSEFDRIYIEDSIDSGVTWVDRGSSSSNPVYVSSGNSAPRQVRARFSKIRGGLTGYSNIVSVTPDPLVSFNDQAPNKPTSFSGVGSVDSSGVIGFNGVINFTWTPDVSSSNVRGYRIKFRPYKAAAPFEEFSYVDSPGTGTKYRLAGLAVGTTYEIAVGSFNEFNKESISYTSGTNVLVPGTPFIGTNVTTTGYFEAFPGSGNTSNAFRFGYGVESGKRGITFNPNNYWYIDSDASALFKLGGDNENYIQWNGQTFIVQGDLRAKKGNFSGSVEIISGGSLFSGVMNQNQSGITGAGFILNNNGLKFSSSTISDITTISGTTGRFVTSSAEIGGWNVGASTISSTGITLTSGSTVGSTSIIATNAGGYVGIKPKGTVGSDIVLWAGNTASPTANNAASGQAGFQVNADGQLRATGAIISGVVSLESGSSLGGLVPDSSKVYYSGTTPVVPTGGHKQGDSWVDTANGNQLKIWSGTAWVITQDSAAALAVANQKTKTTYGPTQPTNSILGDVWYDTNTGINYFKVYNGTLWTRMKDSDITAADLKAASALTEAEKKSTTTSSATAPSSPKAGDIWFDINFNYFKVWSTTVTPAAWVRLKDGDLSEAQTNITAINAKADNALAKVVKFGEDGSLASNLTVKFNSPTPGSINSQYQIGQTIFAKNTYSSDVPGYFLGWETGPGGAIYPAFNVGNNLAYLKYSNATQTLEVRGTIKATAGDFLGDVKAGGGAITIGLNGISAAGFSINTSGAATFTSGTFAGNITSTGTITGGTITGSNISTSGNFNGSLRMNSSNNQLEWLGTNAVVIGRAFVYAGNQTIIASGAGGDYSAFPSSAGMVSLSPSSVSLQVTNAAGNSIGGLTIDSAYATFSSLYVRNLSSAVLTEPVFRNISMGTDPKLASAADGIRGDIYIQFA